MQNNLNLLKTMMLDQKKVEDIYRPGPYWISYQRRAYKAILKGDISNFRDNFAVGKGYVDVFCTNPYDLDINLKSQLINTALQLPVIKKIKARYQQLLNSQISQQLNLKNIIYSDYF